MGAWASESPNPVNQRSTPLRFRCHVAMAGALGISGNLVAWTAQDRLEATELIAAYKEIRDIVAHGDLYRLTAPSERQTTAVAYHGGDGRDVVILAWRATPRFGQPEPPLRLPGVDTTAWYVDAKTGARHAGAALSHQGLAVALPSGDHASVLVHLIRE